RRGRRRVAGAELAELAALADGSLAPERRELLEARVGTSAALAGRLAEQQRALALVRGAAAEVEAPAGLRARVEAQRRGPAGRRSWRLAVVAVGATAALAVALGLVLVGGGNTGERFLATLAATELAPGAGGEAALTRTSSGWRIELAASGL